MLRSILILFLALLVGCATPTKKEPEPMAASYLTNTFSLKASLLQSETGDRLKLTLLNISPSQQPISVLTNLFEGKIFLQDREGQTHEFMERKYTRLAIIALLGRSTWQFAPEESIEWEFGLNEFVDLGRSTMMQIMNPSTGTNGPTLQSAFVPGCAIKASLRIDQRSLVDRDAKKFTGTVYSEPVERP